MLRLLYSQVLGKFRKWHLLLVLLYLIDIGVYFGISTLLEQINANIISQGASLLREIITLAALFLLLLLSGYLKSTISTRYLVVYPKRELFLFVARQYSISGNLREEIGTNIGSLYYKLTTLFDYLPALIAPIFTILKALIVVYFLLRSYFFAAVISFALIAAIVPAYRKMQQKKKKGYACMQMAVTHTSEKVNELVDKKEIIEGYYAHDFFLNRFKSSATYLAKSLQSISGSELVSAIGFKALPFCVPIIAFLIYGIGPQSTINITKIAGFYSLFLFLCPLINMLLDFDFTIYKVLHSLVYFKPFIEAEAITQLNIKRLDTLALENVTFSPNTTDIIRNTSLLIRGGERVGIVGKTGSGKSTLSKILALRTNPNNGKVLYNGEEIRKIFRLPPGVLSYIGREPFIFNDTLRANIGLGKMFDEELAGKMFEIMEIDIDLNTVISRNLSLGERIRIDLIRNLLTHPDFIILDEALSTISSRLEHNILTYIYEIVRTVVIISHRLSSFSNINRILFIEDGEITFDGPIAAAKKKPEFSILFGDQIVGEQNA